MRLFSWMLLVLLVLVGWIGCKIKDTPKAVVNDEKKEVVVGSVTTQKIIWEKDHSQMALIPAGSFGMGDHFNEGRDDGRELPVHTVELDAFYIDVKEVTVGQFREFVNRSGYQWVVARARPDYRKTWDRVAEYSPGDEHPMVFVNWGDARAYAKWAGKRLPTEAEWEYAARGGLIGKRYPWGDEKMDGSQCNFADKNAPNNFSWADRAVDDGYEYTAPVGSFEANGYGLYDMTGNVMEWCADRYGKNYYSSSHLTLPYLLPSKNPPGPYVGSERVLRGGDWSKNGDDYSFGYLRVSARLGYGASKVSNEWGFRCVADVE